MLYVSISSLKSKSTTSGEVCIKSWLPTGHELNLWPVGHNAVSIRTVVFS